MLITLHLLVSQTIFEFTKKTSIKSLVTNFEKTIKEITGSDVDVSPTSSVYLAAKGFVNLFKRKHDGRKSVKWIIENEEEYLKQEIVDVPVKKQRGAEKRKSFEDLKGNKSKNKRVDSAIEEMEKDAGLKDGVFKELKTRN